MAVLSAFMTSQRTALAASPASLTNLPEGVEIDDLPESTNHKTFMLRVSSVPDLRSMHGGGVVEYAQELELEVHWDPEVDGEALHTTIADDLENIAHVMLKTSNRTGTATDGIMLCLPIGGSVEQVDTNDWRALLRYEVVYRITQDMT